MTQASRTPRPTLTAAALAALVLALAGCAGAPAGEPPPPRPAKPASNPFQADVTARSYTLNLAGTPARTRSASAAATLAITAARDQVCWKITRLAGVPAPQFAYIHRGGPGTSGPVVIPLGTRYRPAGCVTEVAPALLAGIEARPADYYLAIHDQAHPQGAIRGQL